MMGKFKAGEIVRAIRETTSLSERHPAGSEYVVGESKFPEVLNPKEFVAGPDGNPTRYIFPEEDFELVPVLDPSKVKAGDYIEAESDGPGIKGPVSHINENGYVSIQHLGSFAIDGITTKDLGYRLFTLTAHQPAPEPEPELTRFVSARLPGGTDVQGFLAHVPEGANDSERVVAYMRPDGALGHSRYTTFHPLVVIDPAEVDADAVYEAVLPLVEHDLGNGSIFRVKVTVRKVLAHLGIEAP